MQLGDAEAVGVVDHHHRGVGHVDAHFDHRRRHQYIDLAGGEPAHHRIFHFARQLAMQHLDPELSKRPAAQLGEQVLDSGGRRSATVAVKILRIDAGRTGGGNSGAYHVRLTAVADFLNNPLPYTLQPGGLSNGVDDDGGRLSSSGRNLPQGGCLEITKDRHCDRPWDGRRCHYQHMRPSLRLGAQRCPLLDTKPMLLVNHDQAEIGKLDIGAEQSMSSDDDSGSAGCSLERRLATPRSRGRARDQYDARSVLRRFQRAAAGQLTQHPGDRLVVLSGEHLGWRQQGSLAARINHRQHRAQRDQCFA
jgi:hypothetical protein